MFLLAVFLLTVHFVCPAWAQQKVKIVGRVVDDQQNPIEFATVAVPKQLAATNTNLKGQFVLEVSSADSVQVVASMLGYQTRKRLLKKPSGTVTLNLVLPSMNLELGTVTVREVQRKTGSMDKLDVSKTKGMPSTTGNAVEEMVATQAGVSTHNELSSQYNVRGGSFDENCVYINGVEVYRPLLIRSGQQEGLSIINSDMVHSIGFSAGGFEAKYGDKMSSVLDITYKKPTCFEGSASASLLGANLYLGYGNKHFAMTHGLRYKTNQYLLGSLETKGEYRPSFVDYQTYMSWTPHPRWSLDFIGNISQNRYEFIPTDRETKFGTMFDAHSFKVYFDGQEKDLFRTFFGTLSLTHHFNERAHLTLLGSAYSTQERESFDIQGQYWLDQAEQTENMGVATYMEHARNHLSADVKSFKLMYEHRLGGHLLQGGLTWKNEHISERNNEWEMRDSVGYSIPHTGNSLNLIYNIRSVNAMTSNRWEIYLQDQWRMKNRFGLMTLNYGLRLSRWTWNRETLLSPRVSLGLIPAFNEDFTFRLATGLYYQAPFYKELRDTTLRDGNTIVTFSRYVKSQRSLHFVLGADYKFRIGTRPFKATAEAYYKALSNLIPYNVDNMRIVYYGGNCATGYCAGLDLKIFGEFVPGADSWVSLSVMKANETINGQSVPQPTDQRYALNLYFTDFFPGTTRWKMTLKGCLAGGLPFGPPHTGLEEHVFRAPSYRRADIGMSYRLLDNEDHHLHRGIGQYLRNVWLGLDCFNVFGINNVSSYYWITDTYNQQFAVPNYLTGRQINGRVLVEF